jgi:hypothetical protein
MSGGVNHQTKCQPRRTSDGVTAARRARYTDLHSGRAVFFPVRYADDFVVLVSGTEAQAAAERKALETVLRDGMGLTLSPEKTRVTWLQKGFEFLGHRVRLRWDYRYGWTPRIEIPKQKAADLRYAVKVTTGRATTTWSFVTLLRKLNPILRGWAHFYRYCTGAKDVFSSLDWVRPRSALGDGYGRNIRQQTLRLCCLTAASVAPTAIVRCGRLTVVSSIRWRGFRCGAIAANGWYQLTSPRLLESRMHNERCTSGSARGHVKPATARSL